MDPYGVGVSKFKLFTLLKKNGLVHIEPDWIKSNQIELDIGLSLDELKVVRSLQVQTIHSFLNRK